MLCRNDTRNNPDLILSHPNNLSDPDKGDGEPGKESKHPTVNRDSGLRSQTVEVEVEGRGKRRIEHPGRKLARWLINLAA